jgi:hypothetical protein
MHQLGHKIVLPRTEEELTTGKGCLVLSITLLVPSGHDEESATPLEESTRNAELRQNRMAASIRLSEINSEMR